MKRQFDAACRQYEVKETTGDGCAEWFDGLKSGMPSVKLLGKTTQQVYTGKNLFQTSRIPPNSRIITVGADYIVITPLEPYTGNGYTSTAVTLRDLSPGLIAGRQYTLSFESEASRKLIYLGGCSSTWLSGTSKTMTEEMLSSIVVFYGMSSTDGDPEKECRISNIQIEEGETATAYEPYVGGIPSPNLFYPQEVKGNNATVQSLGQNLFPSFKDNTTENGVTVTRLHDGGYLLNGICTLSTNLILSEPMETGVYTFSCRFEGVLPSVGIRSHIYHPESRISWAIITNDADTNKVFNFRVTEPDSPQFQICLWQGHNYHNVKLYPFLVKGMYSSDTMPEYVPYCDGGKVTAPKLMRAVDGTCQSTYDSQTGEFVNWWWPLTFNGSEAWNIFPANHGFFSGDALPECMSGNAYWSNVDRARKSGEANNMTGARLICGRGDTVLYHMENPFYDDTLSDKGLANWKAYLAAHPLELWVSRNEPEVTNIGPSRLTCPTGYGQIVQVAGDIPDCPLEVRYLSHGGNLK